MHAFLIHTDDGDRFLLGAFPIFPQSETNFFEKLTGAQFRFTKDAQGMVTTLTHDPTGATLAWFPDWEAKKVSPVVEPQQLTPRSEAQ